MMNRRIGRSFPGRVLLVMLCIAVGLALAAKDCPRCGTSNPDNARFCKNCGYGFPPPRPQPQPQPAPALRGSVTTQPGRLTINSTPDGAAVVVNDTERGTTPLTLTDLPPGRYDIKLSLAGYRRYTTSVTVVAPTVTLRVTTIPPNAEVLIGDRVMGPAPDTGLIIAGLRPGSLVVVARLAGRPDQSVQVTLSADEPVRNLEIRLPLVDGFLRVSSDPRGAFVKIDGEPAGRTNLVAALKPGRYRLDITLDGFRHWRRDTEITLGDTTLVSALLAPVRERRWALLAVSVAGIAGGAAGAALGENAYEQYHTARSPDEAEDFRRKTVLYDWTRNIAGSIGVLSLGAFFVF